MIRVVIDTNIALSGFLSYTSTERHIINYAMKKKITLVGSKGTLEEFSRKLDENERFKKVARDFMFPKSKLIATYKSLVRLIEIQPQIEERTFCIEDIDDDVFIKAALSSNTKILVSNDKHLLKISPIENDVRVVKAQKFLEVLRKNFK